MHPPDIESNISPSPQIGSDSELAESELAESELSENNKEMHLPSTDSKISPTGQQAASLANKLESLAQISELASSATLSCAKSVSETTDSELADSELADSELADSELAESELADSELADSELAESELACPAACSVNVTPGCAQSFTCCSPRA